MTKVTRKGLTRVALRMNEAQLRTLQLLMRDTGLGKSGVLKLAMTELAARRLPKTSSSP